LEDRGNFVVGEPVEFPKSEDDALIFGEFGECGLDIEPGVDGRDVPPPASTPPLPMAGEAGGVGGERFVLAEHADGVFVLAAEECGLAVADGEKPGFDGGAFLEGAQGAEGGGEGFLDDIFGIGVGFDESRGEAEQGRGVTVHEAVERLGVAFPGAVQEFEISLFQQVLRPFWGLPGGIASMHGHVDQCAKADVCCKLPRSPIVCRCRG